jgi:hypothetical protein
MRAGALEIQKRFGSGGSKQVNPNETIARIVNHYIRWNQPNFGSSWLDWKDTATVNAATTGVLLTIRTTDRWAVMKQYGVGYQAGSAVTPLWDWFLSVNRRDFPSSENLAGVFSVVSPTPIDRDLLNTHIIIPPTSTVEIRVVNAAPAINIDVWGRIVGWYL